MPLEIKLQTITYLKAFIVRTYQMGKRIVGVLLSIVKLPSFYSMKQQMGRIFIGVSVYEVLNFTYNFAFQKSKASLTSL